ncbi:hypothetical protein [Ralstonia syzygii]|uniref:hypothetical protein n=1 Tax=Ralstonia syzygii TaxID=28097 RepID=UPI0018D05F4E|nr:hypothetical protein [Ralstonia syzygii]
MGKPAITEADVRWMHGFLHLTTPFEAMPPALRRAVESAAAALLPRVLARSRTSPPTVDLKRCAAGDRDD